jgi:hypothetical protein
MKSINRVKGINEEIMKKLKNNGIKTCQVIMIKFKFKRKY